MMRHKSSSSSSVSLEDRVQLQVRLVLPPASACTQPQQQQRLLLLHQGPLLIQSRVQLLLIQTCPLHPQHRSGGTARRASSLALVHSSSRSTGSLGGSRTLQHTCSSGSSSWGQKSPVPSKLPGWAAWLAVPRIVAPAVTQQQQDQGWDFNSSSSSKQTVPMVPATVWQRCPCCSSVSRHC